MLIASGMNTNERAFFSLLGVTQYLTRDAVVATLREIATIAAPKSELVMQYLPPPSALSAEEGEIVAAHAANRNYAPSLIDCRMTLKE